MRVGIVAGEASGDQLAAGLMREIRRQRPEVVFEAVAGPNMREVGCEILADANELAVMGLAEVLPEVARLWKLRRRLIQHWSENPPDVFVGVDAPDFNLGLSRALIQRGVPTVHYVSPTVWAWRAGRVHKIARSTDALLCLFPFEPACYDDVSVEAHFVGHPFARAMRNMPSKTKCREDLGLAAERRVLALVPGSRSGEVGAVAPVMLEAAARLQGKTPDLEVVIPAASAERRQQIEEIAGEYESLRVHLTDGDMRRVLRAADVALVTSGTATLETLLAGTPMAVVYRASAFTNFLMRGLGLLKSRFVSLPNVLAGRPLVAEFLQEQAEPQALERAVHLLLDRPGAREYQLRAFSELAESLLRETDREAAAVVLKQC